MGDLIHAEVPSVYLDERERELAENALSRYDLARLAARNAGILRAKGLPPPSTLESLIATFAIEKGWTLLHDTPGYAPFEEHLGLKVPELGRRISS